MAEAVGARRTVVVLAMAVDVTGSALLGHPVVAAEVAISNERRNSFSILALIPIMLAC